jgi:hypothetical protein
MDCILCDGQGRDKHDEKCELCLGSGKQPSIAEVQGLIAKAIKQLPDGIHLREQMKQLPLQAANSNTSG